MAEYIVKLNGDAFVDVTAAEAAITGAGATITTTIRIPYSYIVDGTAEQIAAIPNVQHSSLSSATVAASAQSYNINHLARLVDPSGTSTTYSPRYSTSADIVYLIDTGIDSDHPEFTGATIDNLYTNFGTDFEDTVGHGTMVGSLIIGQNIGVASEATLKNVKLFNSASGNVTLGEITNAINAIMTNHITNDKNKTKVVCLPWNLSQNNLIDALITDMDEQNLVVVTAAGNDGVEVNTKSPAGVDQVITVGAHNSNFEVAGFTNFPFGADSTTFYSNYGAQVDIFAPGVGVSVATNDGLYSTADGTSLSAGIVAGAALHLCAAFPDNRASSIKNILIAEGSTLGSTLLSFANVANVDYSQVNRSITTVESSTSNSFAVLPSGDLITMQRGNVENTTIGIKAEATNVEILEFAPLPPFANLNLTTGVININTSSLDANAAPGVYLFAVKGEMAGEVSVEEYAIKLYNTNATELDDEQNVTSYYYDTSSSDYDAVVHYQVSTSKF